MTRTPVCPGKVCRIARRASIAAAMFAAVIWSTTQPAQADPLLDEVVTFNGEIFYFEHKVPALVIGVVRNGETLIRGFGERAGSGSKASLSDRVASTPRRMTF